ncbi:hypothetical protein GH714_027771 [Hevea brasiliensis]|uniref:Uncharacterized protein n=1 Tax=Hevea brasiliensis TaxID=3981 RepID=A0A6A6MJ38_HEVBR|nr:hypothetical protein GH714_027771 [Hevea brasiliensis]
MYNYKGLSITSHGLFEIYVNVYKLLINANGLLAIALHNIPEGVAVALFFCYTKQVAGIQLPMLSGFAEPLGVVLAACLFPSNLSPEILKGLLGSVGEVMAFLNLHEMLPLALIMPVRSKQLRLYSLARKNVNEKTSKRKQGNEIGRDLET